MGPRYLAMTVKFSVVWCSTLWVYCLWPNLSMIAECGGYKSPSDCLTELRFFLPLDTEWNIGKYSWFLAVYRPRGRRSEWNLPWYSTPWLYSLVTILGPDEGMGWTEEPQTYWVNIAVFWRFFVPHGRQYIPVKLKFGTEVYATYNNLTVRCTWQCCRFISGSAMLTFYSSIILLDHIACIALLQTE